MLITSTAPKRLLLATGWLLVFAGLFHAAVWLASGQPWEGSVSWRKPALFGVSGGFTLVSLGLLYKLLAPQPWDIWLAGTLGGAMSFEVTRRATWILRYVRTAIAPLGGGKSGQKSGIRSSTAAIDADEQGNTQEVTPK